MKKVELVKIETIEAFCGMEAGTVKEVPLNIAKSLIDRKRAKLFGTETPSDENPYSKLKVDALRELCAERGIEFADEKKAQLVELLVAFDSENEEEEEKEPTEE